MVGWLGCMAHNASAESLGRCEHALRTHCVLSAGPGHVVESHPVPPWAEDGDLQGMLDGMHERLISMSVGISSAQARAQQAAADAEELVLATVPNLAAVAASGEATAAQVSTLHQRVDAVAEHLEGRQEAHEAAVAAVGEATTARVDGLHERVDAAAAMLRRMQVEHEAALAGAGRAATVRVDSLQQHVDEMTTSLLSCQFKHETTGEQVAALEAQLAAVDARLAAVEASASATRSATVDFPSSSQSGTSDAAPLSHVADLNCVIGIIGQHRQQGAQGACTSVPPHVALGSTAPSQAITNNGSADGLFRRAVELISRMDAQQLALLLQQKHLPAQLAAECHRLIQEEVTRTRESLRDFVVVQVADQLAEQMPAKPAASDCQQSSDASPVIAAGRPERMLFWPSTTPQQYLVLPGVQIHLTFFCIAADVACSVLHWSTRRSLTSWSV